MRRRILAASALAIAVLALMACAGHSPKVATVAAPRVDPDAVYVGAWAYDVSIGDRIYKGVLTLAKDATGWQGKIDDDQGEAFKVRSVAVGGDSVKVAVESAEGEPATVAVARQADGSLAGKVIIAEGEGTFTARKK